MHDAVEEPMTADDLRRWLGDDARPRATSGTPHHDRRAPRWRRRSTLLITAATIPWLLMGALVMAGALPPWEGSPDVAGPDPARRGTRGATAGAVAVRLVRDAVTSTGDGVATALDAAAAEPPDPLHDDTWIVRVHAVVLHGDRRRWRSATHEIWAAPVGRRDGAIVGLDHPWRVARGADRIVELAWQPADVDLDEVRAALRRVGLPATADVRVERHPHLASVLRAVVGQEPGEHHVWLRRARTIEVLGHERTMRAAS